MIPWGTRENLREDEFYNRVAEIDNLKSLLNTTSNGNAPQILLTGLRGVGKTVFLKKIKKELDDVLPCFFLFIGLYYSFFTIIIFSSYN